MLLSARAISYYNWCTLTSHRCILQKGDVFGYASFRPNDRARNTGTSEFCNGRSTHLRIDGFEGNSIGYIIHHHLNPLGAVADAETVIRVWRKLPPGQELVPTLAPMAASKQYERYLIGSDLYRQYRLNPHKAPTKRPKEPLVWVSHGPPSNVAWSIFHSTVSPLP